MIITPINNNTQINLIGEDPMIYKIDHRGIDYSFNKFNKSVIQNRDSQKIISFVSPQKKILIWLSPKFFHAIRDFLFQILSINETHGPFHIIVDIKNNNLSENDYNRFLFKLFDDLKITYSKFDSSKYNFIEVNNCHIINGFELRSNSMTAFDTIKTVLKNTDIKPFRKVYVSRKIREQDIMSKEFTHQRIESHDALENIFKNAGFEIVYAEKFDNFEDQLQYFYETKIIAGLTGSGLTNMLFMQPGNMVIEIVSPILLPYFDEGIRSELHHYYKELSVLKDHTIINIPNLTNDINALETKLTSFLSYLDK